MEAVVLINAAPGFEEAVHASVNKLEGVAAVARVKKENYDLAVLIDVADADEVQRFVTSRLRGVSGIQGAELLEAPSDRLIAQLRQRG